MLRKILTSILCALTIISASACSRIVSEINAANSELVTRTIPGIQANFNAIHATTGFDVTYTVGSRPSVVIECSEVAVDHVDVYVKNGTLHIGLKETLRLNNVKLRAQVTGPVLTDIKATAGADIEVVSPMSGVTLKVVATSGADIDLEAGLKYTTVSASCTSGADINIGEVICTTLTTSATSGADLDVKAINAKNVTASCTSGADMTLAGVTDTVDLAATSAADISAKSLGAKSGSASATSGADIECSVLSLSISKSSGGSVDNR